MNPGRRTFLRTAGLAVSAGVLGPSVVLAAEPAASGGKAPASDMPRGMTFVTIRRGQEQSLGIKTTRGILIAYISKHFTLKPGDIIFTGTPEGVIAGYPREKQVWLKAGDRLTSTIEKLGELQFTLA
jgi:hypothetical protein